MRVFMRKIGLVAMVTVTLSLLLGTLHAEAAVKWAFSTSNGKKKASVNATITMEKGEYQDMNLYRNGKQIKEKDTTYTVKWYSSDKNVVYVDKASGKMKADKYSKMTKDTGKAKITAVITNKTTGTMAKKSFTVKVKGNSEANNRLSAEQVKIGGYVTFGSYEQDNVLTNGKEPIEWMVLDVQDGKALLLSRYGLDDKPYAEGMGAPSATWETSTLRKWLNSDFLSSAFTKEEQNVIQTTVLKNDDNAKFMLDGGNDTKDKVFVLSVGEAEKYFPEDEWNNVYKAYENPARTLRVTEYTLAKNGYTTLENGMRLGIYHESMEHAQYSLRSPQASVLAAYVNTSGVIVDDHLQGSSAWCLSAVRPAIWVTLDGKTQVSDSASKEVSVTAGISEKEIKTSEYVTFGNYEQDGNIKNGKEEVEWKVLAIHEGKALLISRYCLEYMPFNEKYESITWENSSIRKWLNNEFLDTAFDKAEKEAIIEKELQNFDNPWLKTDGGNDTVDKVFLLSANEMTRYSEGEDTDEWGDLICPDRTSAPTQYVIEKGAMADSEGNCRYWLRTPGDAGRVMIVKATGLLDFAQYRIDVSEPEGIRPALWVNISQ